MKPRFSADYRTLLWAYVLFPVATLASYAKPTLLVGLLPLVLYVGFCAGVFAHNHNHCPVFRNRRLNALHAAWVSIFYGHPIFVWVPTHNLNHHRFLNREGDATITWRYTRKNTWLVASTYFLVAAYWQDAVTKTFVKNARTGAGRLYRQIIAQRRIFVAAHGCLLGAAVVLHGWRLGPLVYLGTFGASAAMGLWGMFFSNFIQHVHCDPWSLRNHSRNFVSKVENFLVFNNGYHTAHHEHPGAHWSRLAKLHANIAPDIHPDLCQPSVVTFCLRAYALGSVLERFRTRQIGRPAYATSP